MRLEYCLAGVRVLGRLPRVDGGASLAERRGHEGLRELRAWVFRSTHERLTEVSAFFRLPLCVPSKPRGLQTVMFPGMHPVHLYKCRLYRWIERMPGGTRGKTTVWKVLGLRPHAR